MRMHFNISSVHFLRNDRKIIVYLTLFSIMLLFVISPDSYTHDLYGRCDSAWFFMCGKAWMEGMTPYVEFTDSKGPLLWLIYGIGYLISPRNYIGVFWMSCFWYAIIFYITYLTARIFFTDRKTAVISTILMAIAYFNPAFHYETRAEDWCQLFLVLSFYLVCKMLYADESATKKLSISFFTLGVCFSSIILIKFNIAAMQAVFILFAIIYVIRKRLAIFSSFLYLLAGIFTMSLPFLIYLFNKGIFDDFIQEYFINTFHTVSYSNGLIKDYLTDWKNIFHNIIFLTFFIFLVIGSSLAYFKLEKYKVFPFISSMLIFAITARNGLPYYFNSCAICCFWPILYLIKYLSQHKIRLKPIGLGFAVFLVLTTFGFIKDQLHNHNFFWNDGKEREQFYTAEYYISQIEHPKIINASFYEYGHGILSKSLPGAKYWSKQNGSTKEMDKSHVDAILSMKADFIIKYKDVNLLIDEERLRSSGYPYCLGEYVFSKKNIEPPTGPIHVSNWEILTKQMPEALKK